MVVYVALLAVLVPASVTLVGYWLKRQSEKRLDQEAEEAEERRSLETSQENSRLKLDAAMRAAGLFGPSGDAVSSAARSAAGLLALTQVGFTDLAVALLVDLWRPQSPQVMPMEAKAADSVEVSDETAVQVINAALETGKPDAQLIAAELLCRNADRLDICDSLHWPSSVNSAWIPELPVTAKLLIVDALVHMALASEPTQNSLRELAVRLYGISVGDPEERVKGCIGTLMTAILPALRKLGYTDFMKGPGHGLVTLAQMEGAAAKASPHPDGYFEMIVKDRSERLEDWSRECTAVSYAPMALATASCALKSAGHVSV
jgi:hypothetical protein